MGGLLKIMKKWMNKIWNGFIALLILFLIVGCKYSVYHDPYIEMPQLWYQVGDRYKAPIGNMCLGRFT